MIMSFKVGGLFSGVGGIELGFLKAGFEISWANEIDQYSCMTYKTNFDHLLLENDIKEIDPKELESVDILVAGFPCQSFSIAGHRKGFDDERGNLFFEIIRIIKGLKVKPKVLFFENVKNFYTHDKKRTFKKVYDLLHEELGYSVFHDVLNASEYTTLPQNRERTFIICFQGEKGWEFDEIRSSKSYVFNSKFPPNKIDETDSFRKYLEEAVDEQYFYDSDKYNYRELKKAVVSDNSVYQWRRVYVRENKKGVCPTLTANMGQGGHNVPIIKVGDRIRKLTPKECFNLQGFDKDFKLPQHSDSRLYRQAGNSVCVPLITKLALLIKQSLEES